MRHVSIFFFVAVVVLGISAMVHAEVIISQDFDDTTTFPLGAFPYTGGYGDASTTEGLWHRWYPGSANPPTVVNDYAHSGTQSAYMIRSGTDSGKLEGLTDNTIIGGIVETTMWFRRNGTGAVSCGAYNGSTPVALTYFTSAGLLHVLADTGWAASTVTVPTEAWFGVRTTLDMDNDLIDLSYNDGTGWNLELSGVTARGETTIDRLRFSPQGGNVWVDDCTLRIIPEPSTLALLATGLIGLLCCAWRKRK